MECSESEDSALRILALNQPFDLPSAADFSEADTKANILLQCHFSRKAVPVDLKADQRELLVPVVRLIHAMVEVLSLATSGS
jgi:pre-mRNA-splicing helicase BRR2